MGPRVSLVHNNSSNDNKQKHNDQIKYTDNDYHKGAF